MRKTALLVCMLCLSILATTQTSSILAKAKKAYSSEQVYVHTDKGSYISGETIWLKAYVMNDDIPSAENGSIKIQLMDNDGLIIAEKVYPIINSIATGNISLPVTVKEGRYFLRAFTNTAAQKKYAKDFIAPVLIYNPASIQKIGDASFNYKPVAQIQFFPCNTLVNGLAAETYVAVTDQLHQPIQTNGWLVNAENDTLAAFKTDYTGVAEIKFVPNNTENYFIKLADRQTEQKIGNTIQSEGTVLLSNYQDNNYFITILSNQQNNTVFHVIGEANDHLLFEVNAANGQRIKIPMDELSTGIFRIVLTDANNNIITERFLFSNNDRNIITAKDIAATVSANDTILNTIHLQTLDTANATLSVVLTDKAFEYESNIKQENIINRFLLTAHLQEEHPFLYGWITDLSKADVHAVNKILATQKILKPGWNEIVSATENNNSSDTIDYIKIEGKVKPEGFKKFPKDATLNLVFESKKSVKDFLNTPIILNNKEASIAEHGLIFYDTLSMHYKLNDKTYQTVKLELAPTNPDSYFSKEKKKDIGFMQFYAPQQLVQPTKAAVTIDDKKQMVYKNLSDEVLAAQKDLPNVTVTSYKTWRQKAMDVSDRYGDDIFRREAEQMFDFINSPYINGTKSVSQYLKLYGRRMRVMGDDITTTAIIQWPVLWTQKPYTVFIDGARVDFADLDVLTIDNVALIKVYHTLVLADENGPAIAVFTKHPEDRDKGATSLQTIDIAGYSAGLIFMNPEKKYLSYIHKKNLLGTFYWNPFLFWNNEQKDIQLEFYNINQVTESTLIIQGMNADGKLLYVNKTIQSK